MADKPFKVQKGLVVANTIIVTNTNGVGINTSIPEKALSVNGAIVITQEFFIKDADGGNSNNIGIYNWNGGFYVSNYGSNLSWDSNLFTVSDAGLLTVAAISVTSGLTVTALTANGTVGSAGQVLTSNGTSTYWSTVVSGGNSVPGGSNTFVQFNDSGVLEGNAGFTYTKTTNTISLGNSTVNAYYGPQTANITGEIVSKDFRSDGGNFRAIGGNYGFIQRNDGSSYYFLVTASANQYGTWNTLRPISINLSTGYLSLQNGLVTVNTTAITTGTPVLNSTALLVGTSVVNSTVVASGANVVLSTSSVSVGNSTVNASITSGGLYVNGYVAIDSTKKVWATDIEISGIAPMQNWYQSDGDTNGKYSRFYADGTVFSYQILNDAYSIANTFVTFERSNTNLGTTYLYSPIVALNSIYAGNSTVNFVANSSTVALTSGNIYTNAGNVTSNGELIATLRHNAQLRLVGGNYGAFHRFDGSTYYMMFTASGNQYGTWNSLRPYQIDAVTGYISFQDALMTVNTTAVTVGSNVNISTSRIFVGNSTVNAAINSSSFTLNGTAVGSGSPPTIQVFTANGTWTKPSNCKKIKVTITGGGGAGADGDGGELGGSGGGSGGTSIKYINVESVSTVTVVVGLGGAIAGGSGNPGTNTVFTAYHTAVGGSGGTLSAGGAGGTSSNGGINLTGGAGDVAQGLQGGAGGGSFWGSGSSRAAATPTIYGIGGRGDDADAGQNRTGMSGICVVEEYY